MCVGEQSYGVVRGDGGVEPWGIIFVPAEIVATGGEVVGFGEVHEEISLPEIEAGVFGIGSAPLHLVFGDEDGALVEEEGCEVGAVELGVGDGGTEEEVAVLGDFAEFGEPGGAR